MALRLNIGALLIRIGFWGPLDYSNNKEPHNNIGNYGGPDITVLDSGSLTIAPLPRQCPFRSSRWRVSTELAGETLRLRSHFMVSASYVYMSCEYIYMYNIYIYMCVVYVFVDKTYTMHRFIVALVSYLYIWFLLP